MRERSGKASRKHQKINKNSVVTLGKIPKK